MSSLDAVLQQYEKSKQNSSSGMGVSMEERMKRYFAPILTDNERSGQRRIRILPTLDGSSPFKEAWYHEVEVSSGKWQKLYDPGKNDNERSPLNEVYEELMSTGKESDRELAKQYRSRKYYIVKVIDRDNEQDGPKFWRFKHNYRNEGILDKIIPIWRNKGDITDPDKGRDLIIELSKHKSSNSSREYTMVSTIMYDDPSPIHEDNSVQIEWIKDETEWTDVYSKKPVEFLEAIARGETPKWDSDKGGYVYGDSSFSDNVIGGNDTKEDPQANANVDTDLPF